MNNQGLAGFYRWLLNLKSLRGIYRWFRSSLYFLGIKNKWTQSGLRGVFEDMFFIDIDSYFSWSFAKKIEKQRSKFLLVNGYRVNVEPDSHLYYTYFSQSMPYGFKSMAKGGNSTVLRTLWQLEFLLKNTATKPDDFKGLHSLYSNIEAGPFTMHGVDILSDFQSPKIRKGFFFFTMVRNPYTRILSAYLDKIIGPPPRRLDKMVLDRCGLDSRDLSFTDFLELISHPCYGDKEIWDRHWMPVSNHFSDPHDFKELDFVGHLENFEEDIRIVINSICEKAGIKIGSFDNIVRLEISHASHADQKILEHYDDKAIELVKEIYKEDFKILGYSTDIEKASRWPKGHRYRYPRNHYSKFS